MKVKILFYGIWDSLQLHILLSIRFFTYNAEWQKDLCINFESHTQCNTDHVKHMINNINLFESLHIFQHSFNFREQNNAWGLTALFLLVEC